MKIVLDANIFVSAFLWGGKPSAIVGIAEDGLCTLYITNEIVAEIERVLRKRKFRLTEEKVEYYIRRIERISKKITVADSERVTTGGSRDKTDNKYLECAVTANADYVISGDIHLRELKEYRGIKIVNPAEYLEIVNE
jgi:putative PIN family toxin of toxin-antitoxin system